MFPKLFEEEEKDSGWLHDKEQIGLHRYESSRLSS